MQGFFKEFKDFAMRGNVVELAVAVVIGGAFGKIVTSFTQDLLMPPIGLILGDTDFSKHKLVLREAVVENGETVKEAVTFNYGAFIQHTLTFIIIAFCVFLLLKLLHSLRKKEKEKPKKEEPEAPTTEEALLTEIRDLLKKQVEGKP